MFHEGEGTLAATNERILADTRSDQFVTVFYGVLDPESGDFWYANAGHKPGLIIGLERTKLNLLILLKTGQVN